MVSPIFPGCGGHLVMESGAFNSPNYPEAYPPNVECVWTLTSSPGNRLQFSFTWANQDVSSVFQTHPNGFTKKIKLYYRIQYVPAPAEHRLQSRLPRDSWRSLYWWSGWPFLWWLSSVQLHLHNWPHAVDQVCLGLFGERRRIQSSFLSLWV